MGVEAEQAEQAERVESELDRIIARRARERDDADHVAELWRGSTRIHNERRRRENAARWYDHHMTLSDVHRRLSEENEAMALSLLEGGKP